MSTARVRHVATRYGVQTFIAPAFAEPRVAPHQWHPKGSPEDAAAREAAEEEVVRLWGKAAKPIKRRERCR